MADLLMFDTKHADDAPANESTSASGSIEDGSSSDEHDSDVHESPQPSHGGNGEDRADDACAQVAAPPDESGAMSEDEEEMRVRTCHSSNGLRSLVASVSTCL